LGVVREGQHVQAVLVAIQATDTLRVLMRQTEDVACLDSSVMA
jgi:hypothetical protein